MKGYQLLSPFTTQYNNVTVQPARAETRPVRDIKQFSWLAHKVFMTA